MSSIIINYGINKIKIISEINALTLDLEPIYVNSIKLTTLFIIDKLTIIIFIKNSTIVMYSNVFSIGFFIEVGKQQSGIA